MYEELLKSVMIYQPIDGVEVDGTKKLNFQRDIKNNEEGVRLDVYQKGKRKYAVLKSPNKYFPDSNSDYKFRQVDRSMSDDDIIKDSIDILIRIANNSGLFTLNNDQMIINQLSSSNIKRKYGLTYYYLNDGSKLQIEWFKDSHIKTSDLDDDDISIEKMVTYYPYIDSMKWDPNLKQKVKYQRIDGSFDLSYNVKNSDRLIYTGIKDNIIVNSVINSLKIQITKFNGTSISDNKLSLCDIDTEYCKLIPFIDINSIESEKENLNIKKTYSDKTKLFLTGLPDIIEVKAGDNLPDFTVYVNKMPEFINDEFVDLEELDPEYQESLISIEEQQEYKYQSLTSLQEDSSNITSQQAGELAGTPANIEPFSSFDSLINLAGRCARELGKNIRVNAENMKKGYIKGVHGLCPQGTQAVLYALTGIKKVGSVSGNADWFSFKNPTNPSGGQDRGDFYKTGYFQNKIKIKQINGDWKGTYLDKKNKSMWQIGDVIAMGYSEGKPYGHIQVWTGYSWMSDFKQGDSIQKAHVDVESVALWRLNELGLEAVKKQIK